MPPIKANPLVQAIIDLKSAGATQVEIDELKRKNGVTDEDLAPFVQEGDPTKLKTQEPVHTLEEETFEQRQAEQGLPSPAQDAANAELRLQIAERAGRGEQKE